MTKTILVTGATGSQGGALVPLLLEKGFKVRALTRNPAKPAGQRLAKSGCEVVAGDLDDEASLERACDGAYGVFSLQNFWEKGVGYQREIDQGCKLARSAKKAGVQHFVQTSVSGCDNAKGVLHFESKWEIEKYIDSLGLPRTFLREVFFMENFTEPVMAGGEKRAMDPYWVLPMLCAMLDEGVKLHMIAVEDIAWFAADVFAHPDEFIGKHIELASDSLTPAEIRAVFRKVTGKRALPAIKSLTRVLVRLTNPEGHRQFVWNNTIGWHFDLAPLRKRHPHMMTLEQYLTRHYAKSQ
jgi:uncharacterized protein YbjT (DUF2867 family)